MQIKAQLNGLRMAPRKVRAVTNLVKNKDVSNALNQLEFLMKRPVLPLIKLLNSAVANAENNFNMVKENLYIKEFLVDEGIKLKRYMPRAQGRAGEIQKKTSKVRIILDERVAGLKREASEKKTKDTHKDLEDKKEKVITKERHTQGEHEVKTELGKKGNTLNNLGKRLFRRKVI